MAKISSKKNNEPCAYCPSMYIDFDDVKEITGLEVGQTVRVVVRGTIRGISQSKDEKELRASIQLEDFDAEVVTDKTQFDALFDDEET